MLRARIRWSNVARLAAGVGAAALAIAFLPSLLERPQPPPLPPDVGLATAATDAGPRAPGPKPEPAARRPRPRPGGQAPQRQPRTTAGERSRPAREAAGTRGSARRAPTVEDPVPRPPKPPLPAPSPAPAPPEPPVPPASSPPVPEAPPEPAQPEPAPETAAVGQGSADSDPPRGPSEFGFEQ